MALPDWLIPDTPLNEVHCLEGSYVVHYFFETPEMADTFYGRREARATRMNEPALAVRETRKWDASFLESLRTTVHHAGLSPHVSGISSYYFEKERCH